MWGGGGACVEVCVGVRVCVCACGVCVREGWPRGCIHVVGMSESTEMIYMCAYILYNIQFIYNFMYDKYIYLSYYICT